MIEKKIDAITTVLNKLFGLLQLGMNQFIQLKSQLGTIKGYVKKDIETLKKDKTPEEQPKEETTEEQQT